MRVYIFSVYKIVDNTEEQIKPRYSMQIGQSEISIQSTNYSECQPDSKVTRSLCIQDSREYITTNQINTVNANGQSF